MEKELGLTKRRQSLTIQQKLNETHENIEAGKKKSADMQEARRRKENEEADKIAQHELSSLATTLMVKHGLEWYQALEAAKREIESRSLIEDER